MSWPIIWPDGTEPSDPNIKELSELYASVSMTALTLHRVGGNPVTIMPSRNRHVAGWYSTHSLDGYWFSAFYPGPVYPSAEDLHTLSSIVESEAIDLPGPVADVSEVRVGGVVLDPSKYRVEDGRWLVRTDDGYWPRQADDFTVTYLNSYPVNQLGAVAAGVMANEWRLLISRAKSGCRLPAAATTVQRQGITMEITRGMFPDGVTGIPEIDAYLMLFNPFGLKVAPRVYSPDLPRHRQVWSA